MSDLLISVDQGVGRITINRPQARNSLPSPLYVELKTALQKFEYDPAVRVVLVTGAGDHFCAGGDIKEFATTIGLADEARATFMSNMITNANGVLQVMERMPQPVVVSARGMAVGGGLALILAADLVMISDTCKMSAGQIVIGGIPDACVSYNLVRLMGLRRAKQYGFLGDQIDAETALEFGLVNWMVPDSELDERTETLLARLAKGPRLALGLTKAAMNAAHTATMADHCAQEPMDVAACVLEEDFKRAVNAMLGKISKQ